MTPIAHVSIGAVRAYQWTVRPLIGDNCRFFPSCSDYAIEAVRAHGALRGSGLAVRRILRCNPWNAGGYDPVPGCDCIPRPSQGPTPSRPGQTPAWGLDLTSSCAPVAAASRQDPPPTPSPGLVPTSRTSWPGLNPTARMSWPGLTRPSSAEDGRVKPWVKPGHDNCEHSRVRPGRDNREQQLHDVGPDDCRVAD